MNIHLKSAPETSLRKRPAFSLARSRTTRHSDRDIGGTIEALHELDLEGLRLLWRQSYGPPPSLRSVELLRLMLAWRLQAEAEGGIGREGRRKLARRGRIEAEGFDLGIGARLRRDWQGGMVEVVVTPQGFCWGDRVFASLSAAATAIAGSRWNGPRFFGLRRKPR